MGSEMCIRDSSRALLDSSIGVDTAEFLTVLLEACMLVGVAVGGIVLVLQFLRGCACEGKVSVPLLSLIEGVPQGVSLWV